MNRKIALVMYVAGVNPNKVLQICAQVGIVYPAQQNLRKIHKEVKANTMTVAKELLIINQRNT